MITFKCKMCGGDLEFEQGATICECPYCGKPIPVEPGSEAGGIDPKKNAKIL